MKGATNFKQAFIWKMHDGFVTSSWSDKKVKCYRNIKQNSYIIHMRNY